MPAINLGYLLGQATNAATGYRQGQREQQEANRQAQIDDANRLFAEWAKRRQLDQTDQQLQLQNTQKEQALQNALNIAGIRAQSQQDVQKARDEAAAARATASQANRPIQIDNQGRAWVLDATTNRMRPIEGDARFPIPGQGSGASGANQPKTLPASEVSKIAGSESLAKMADDLLGRLDALQKKGENVSGPVMAFGPIGWARRTMGIDSDEVTSFKQALANIGSRETLERSGAAVSAQEFERLRPFLPDPHDTEEMLREKLKGFAEQTRLIINDRKQAFQEAGYRTPSGASPQTPPKPPPPDDDVASALRRIEQRLGLQKLP